MKSILKRNGYFVNEIIGVITLITIIGCIVGPTIWVVAVTSGVISL